jgi:small subunit ribosomal protein S6
MRAYEAMIVLSPPAEDPATQAIVDRVQRIIQEQGGAVEKVEPWGRRRLAYEIAGNREATYFIVNFTSESAATHELERVLGLTDEVLRYVVVRREETPPAAEGEGETAGEGAAVAREAPEAAGTEASPGTDSGATGVASDGAAAPAAESAAESAAEAPPADVPTQESVAAGPAES